MSRTRASGLIGDHFYAIAAPIINGLLKRFRKLIVDGDKCQDTAVTLITCPDKVSPTG